MFTKIIAPHAEKPKWEQSLRLKEGPEVMPPQLLEAEI
jgi:hypothetical protein